MVTLPELTEYHFDPVRQGGTHILLNGKAREDLFGTRRHFYLGWEGLDETEWSTIETAFDSAEPLLFQTHNEDISVVRGNHGSKTYDVVGNIKTNIELEESA